MRRLWSSLRVRLLVASLLWTVGLLYVTHLVSLWFIIGHGAFDRMNRITWMFVAAILLMAAGLQIFRRTLATLDDLRRSLGDVHAGRSSAVSGTYLNEVQPLVDDLNTVLAHRERRVRDAVAKAGDLAHGLKTPLAVLRHESERLEAVGQREAAATVGQQVERMHRHVEYHLAHARAAASGAIPGARCSVAESAAGIARTLERLHADRGVAITLNVGDQHVIRGQREDLDEVLGNLVDNACKWARARVSVSSADDDGRVAIVVDDDGPGIEPSMRAAVLQRGVRADQAAAGSGFGLAIVRDLVDVYGGAMDLEDSPLGGLRVRIALPRA